MAEYFVCIPGDEDRFVEAHRYAIVEHDLVFLDVDDNEIGRVVDFADTAGASVLRA